MKKSILRKIFNIFSAFAILSQSLTPYAVLLPQASYAQEVIPADPTPTIDQTTPTETATPTPTVDETTPTDTVTPVPTDVPAEEVTPASNATDATPTVTPVDNLSPPPSDNPSATQVQEDSTSPTPASSPTPIESGQAPELTGEEQLNIIVLDNISAPSIDLQAVNTYGSATLTTDKPDYAPTDTALITGSNLLPNTTYSLTISSDDPPAVSTTVQVTSDENGVFAYAYQLDGTYRPNYSAELKDSTGTVVATVTFTDTPVGPNNAGTGTEVNGPGTIAWTDENNIVADDTNYATAILTSGGISEYLQGTNYGFSIPVGATINGIQVFIMRQSSSNSSNDSIDDEEIKLLKAGVIVGTNKATSTDWPTSFTEATYGGNSDLWGTTWTPADINANNFGVSLSADSESSSSNRTASVDYMRITVTYTDAPLAIPPLPGSGCFNDAQGANDEPGQKDLTKMCADVSNVPTSIATWWNWDDTAWSGGNTGSACNLFDTDGDGKANYSMCVFVGGDPAVFQSRTLYSCGDDRIDRCTSPVAVAPTTASCGSAVMDEDPFNTSNDTVGYCSTNLSELGSASNVNLIDVCSYPSEQPNSDPSDCIFYKNNTGKLVVNKVLVPSNDSGKFNLQVNSITKATDAGNGGTTGEQVLAVGNHTVREIAGTGTSLSNYTSAIDCRLLHGTGSSVASSSNSGPLTVPVADGDDIVCTITNTRINNGSITIVKDAVPNDAQDFTFTAGGGLSPTTFSLDDDADGILSNTRIFSNLASGTYSVSEGAVTGWTQTSATCSDQSPISAISLQAGENVTCTFTNTRDTGTIELKKAWSGTGGQTTLNIGTTAGGSQVDTQLTGAAGAAPLTTGVNTVNTGTYYVSETGGLTDYTSSLTCTDNGSPVTPGTNDSLSVTTGHAIVCTFTNTRKAGKIELQKDFVGTAENVTIKIGTAQNGSQVDSDVLSADGTDGEHTVDTGNYFVSEVLTIPANYTTGLACYNDVNDNDAVDGGDTAHTVNTGTGQVAVGENDDVICVFTNTRNTGTLLVHKYVDTNGDGTYDVTDDTDANDLGFRWGIDSTPANNTNSFGDDETLDTDSYNVYEKSVTDYHFTGWYDNSGDGSCEEPDSTSLPANVDVNYNEPTEIILCNARDTGSVKVNKLADTDGNGSFETLNPLSFTWSLDGSGTNAMGDTLDNITTDSHDVTENTSNYQFVGWYLGHPTDNQFSCTNLPEYSSTTLPLSVNVTKDNTTQVNLCNQLQLPVLTISKVNDALGDKAPGDIVGFTITIAATQSAAQNVTVTDLLPKGFVYNSGSWHVVSSIHGDITGSISEPFYASPGTWSLGHMDSGETLTLTYSATIDGSQATGTYYDNAWGVGNPVGRSTEILARAVNPGQLDDNFVGTQVAVVNGNQAGVDYKTTTTQSVLGASTFLPATGENTIWVIIATLLSIAGFGTLIAGYRLRKKYE